MTRQRYLMRVFKLFGNEVRMGMLLAMRDGEPKTGVELHEKTGVARATISKNCGDLENMGVVHRTNVGIYAMYTLNRECIEDLRDWLGKLLVPGDLL